MAAVEEQPVASVWTRPERSRRRAQPALSREQIVAEALRILDAEGIDALSMRRLGTELNAGATSMYTHVANKDELMELVVDQVYGEIAVPDPDDPLGWRNAALLCAHDLRAAILRHPWIAPVLGQAGASRLGPNLIRMSENLIGVFENAGFELFEANEALSALAAYTIGVAISEAAWLTSIARSGLTEDEWVRQMWPAAEQAVQGHRRLRTLYESQRDMNVLDTREQGFAYGLSRMLDAFELRLENRGGSAEG